MAIRAIIDLLFYVSESYLFASIVGIELAVVEYMDAVSKRMQYLPAVLVSLHRAPFAFALYVGFGYSPRRVGLYDGDVGTMALAQEAPLVDLEESGRGVRHQFDESFEGQHAVIDKFQHRRQRVLHHRHARSGTCAAALFLR